MHSEIIRRHNEVVSKEDTTYVLGDAAMLSQDRTYKIKPILDKMNGTFHLILGNHDAAKPFVYEELGFQTVHTALILRDGDHEVVLRHDPAACNVMPNKLWLVGHVHNLFRYINSPIKCFNVGVDVNNFYPVTLNQIHGIMGAEKKGLLNRIVLRRGKKSTYFETYVLYDAIAQCALDEWEIHNDYVDGDTGRMMEDLRAIFTRKELSDLMS